MPSFVLRKKKNQYEMNVITTTVRKQKAVRQPVDHSKLKTLAKEKGGWG